MNVSQYLTAEELHTLRQPSNLRGFLAIGTTWAIILGAFSLMIYYPNPLSYFFAWVILGGRHLALAILMHEASHYSLFQTRRLNDFFGQWICAYPTWQDLKRYRVHHMLHHRYAGTEKDPDISLVKPFPMTKTKLTKKLLRDLTGLTGIKRVYGLLLMDFGFIEYTAASGVKKIPQDGRTIFDVIGAGFKHLYGVLVTNTILFLFFHVIGHPSMYLMWVASYLTTFSFIVRIRSIAEHACTEMTLDSTKNTRTTYATILDRLTFAPHRVNFHVEHHLAMTVPYFNLPHLHKLLKKRGLYQHAYYSKSYLDVLKTATNKL